MSTSLLGPDARPSDDDPAVTATGAGDTTTALFSMTRKTPDGSDADYLRWHLLDHLPEQYRIVGFRFGQRWISTPACRAARAASAPPFDDTDHIVYYLFAEPLYDAFRDFKAVGSTLLDAHRMPASSFRPGPEGMTQVRRGHMGVYDVVDKVASRQALVGAVVVPWRPARGVYVVVERVSPEHEDGEQLNALAEVPGVAGVWRFRGSTEPWAHAYAEAAGIEVEAATELAIAVYYLDEDPVEVAGELGRRLADRWSAPEIEPLLAAPFQIVIPWEWDRYLP